MAVASSSYSFADDYDDDDDDSDDDAFSAPVSQAKPEVADKFEEMKGRVLRVIYSTPDGYTVYAIRTKTPDGHSNDITVNITSASKFKIHDNVLFKGEWAYYKGKPTFRAALMMHEIPQGARGVVTWLLSGAVPGIGKKKAEKIAKFHGDNLLHVIDNPVALSADGKACTLVDAHKISDTWNNSNAQPELIEYLGRYGIKIMTIAKIVKKYGAACRRIIEQNPWRLAEEIAGIGFQTADEIGQAAGHGRDSEHRLKAGLKYTLREMTASDGHCAVPQGLLLAKASEVLNVPVALLGDRLAEIVSDGVVVKQENSDLIYPLELYDAENKFVTRIQTLLEKGDYIEENVAREAVEIVLKDLGFRRDESQVNAAIMAICNPVSIITGGPGTGKSTTQKIIVAALKHLARRLQAAAPTGVAAKRLTDVSGLEASTMHRLLKYDAQAGGFTHDRSNPLPTDRVIVDEFSMVDIKLGASFLDAIRPTAGLTMVGDVDQLPSVGPGQLLRDMIESGAIPVTVLQTVHRQSGDNTIVVAAARIKNGMFPIEAHEGGNGFDLVVPGFMQSTTIINGRSIQQRRKVMALNGKEFALSESGSSIDIAQIDEEEAIRRTVVQLMTADLPALGFDPMNDIQVLSPMRKYGLGTETLNAELKAKLNPFSDENGIAFRPERTFSTGDRVMHRRNDYEKSVFNGETGIVDLIGDRINDAGSKERFMRVDYAGHKAFYSASDVEDVELSWATTVHKSQGSEFPVAIIVCPNSHKRMLNRNLIYTAVTRAKKRCIVVGHRAAVEYSVSTVDVNRRFTGLVQMLTPVENELQFTL
jgi:exodeoxyribonuclease V alpha subunit